jgi:hypothetical protein
MKMEPRSSTLSADNTEMGKGKTVSIEVTARVLDTVLPIRRLGADTAGVDAVLPIMRLGAVTDAASAIVGTVPLHNVSFHSLDLR